MAAWLMIKTWHELSPKFSKMHWLWLEKTYSNSNLRAGHSGSNLAAHFEIMALFQ
jgi:hypothetical protein